MIYDENAPLLVERGYYPLPTAPVDFMPAKSPVRWIPSLNQFRLLLGWNTRPAPILTPQPGANIGVRCGNGLVAFDYDDEEAALAISEAFDPSPVNKAGQRAWTPFYRTDFDVPSEDFFDAQGRKVLQILSTGRQTVIPPSIHPDTKEPYRWTNGRSLYDTPLTELPMLPHGYRERILKLGYVPKRTDAPPVETVDPETGEIKNGHDDSPFAELNDVAIRNLSAWVPDLNLYKCRRRHGRTASYEAVASWRESTTGKPLEERTLNLRISGRGIKDFGDDRGYSPLDLVMAARACSLSEAFDWLEQHLGKKSDIEIDLEKMVEAQDAATETNEEEAGPADSAEPKSQFKGYDIQPYRVLRGCETEPRDWVAYKHYLRGTVSTTIGPGAGGKTSLDMVEAYSMALGRDLLGQCTIARPYRVWYHNAEETMKELDRRFAALREHYGIEEGAECDRLFVTCGFDLRIRATDRGKKLDMDTYHRILHTIQERGHEVAVFDPLTAMHNREETNDGLGELMYDFFGPIANITRTAIEIVHHTRKGPPGTEIDYSAIDARGGGAFTFAVRSGRVVNGMKKAEAEAYDIEEADRFSYFRVGRDKPNMVKRGLLGWYKIESQVLENARPDEGRDNEDVGVVTSWTPPAASDPLAMYSQPDKDHWRELAAKNPNYGYHANSKQWFGDEIAKRLNLDLIGRSAKKNKKIVTAILDDLIEDGTLRVVTRKGDDRHDRQFMGPGDAT